ncbi:epoxide hydrolase family protein [Candidatus Poriferisocius sp.]|uniref:epoxide hydrolase family protein n=1 Tax=Candidatus Poriferisocius sp. TaxID=3101276 RepID=UPI003B5A809E
MAEPFRIVVPDEVIEDLHRRLDATRWPQALEGVGWDYGSDTAYIAELCRYWRHDYDWRAHEAALNELPQYTQRIDGFDIHFVHAEGQGPDPLPLVITHGWPSCFWEMHKVVGPLSDPAAHGGDPADAFHVVAPSLPGYGFSSPPAQPGVSSARVADMWAELMAALGYERFGAQGGDWGSAVSAALGAMHPERMVGIHLNMVAPPIDEAALTDEQRQWWEGVKQYRDREWGYVHLQRTKPQTAAVGLTDSPAGLAAWIIEKWWRWSDIDGPGGRDLARRYTLDELCTLLTIYWATATIGPSMRMYYESFGAGSAFNQPPRIAVPTGVAVFNEKNRPPRELAEPYYNITRWTEVDDGGHFPALENPNKLVEEVRAFFRPLR